MMTWPELMAAGRETSVMAAKAYPIHMEPKTVADGGAQARARGAEENQRLASTPVGLQSTPTHLGRHGKHD
jgi:hypothetical protein